MKILLTILIVLNVSIACNSPEVKAVKKEDHSAHGNMHSQAAGYADSVNAGLIAIDTLKGSPHRTAMTTVNGAHLHIEYNSPGVKGRIIWGGLVPYNAVWVTGAHKATTIECNKDFKIGDKLVKAGKYALFTIPGEKEWSVMLNRNHDQHLADDYNAAEDAVRIKVNPKENPLTQRLTYAVIKKAGQDGVIEMSWEKIKIEIPFFIP
jgi:Protein of unknown function (DUF2911)